MGDKLIQVRWGVQRRMEFIDFRLFWDGQFNRAGLIETFGISAAQASADIAQYERAAPSNLAYDRVGKVYRRTPEYAPALIGDTVERFLLQLVAIENQWMRQEDTWFDRVPPVEIVTLGRHRTDSNILLVLLDAINNRLEIDVDYASLTGAVDPLRTILPHALFQSAGRWYVRSWSREHDDFRDYNIHRIRKVGRKSGSDVDVSLDFEWHHQINLNIIPNPELPAGRREAIASEHAMEDGRLVRPCRLSLSFYLMSEYNLDVAPGLLEPHKQQLVLENREDVTRAKAAARQMAKEALSRAGSGRPARVVSRGSSPAA